MGALALGFTGALQAPAQATHGGRVCILNQPVATPGVTATVCMEPTHLVKGRGQVFINNFSGIPFTVDHLVVQLQQPTDGPSHVLVSPLNPRTVDTGTQVGFQTPITWCFVDTRARAVIAGEGIVATAFSPFLQFPNP